MGLQATQSQFAIAAAKLILHAESLGFEVTLGDAYRDERCNYGAPNSKHRQRLAIDLNLFLDGRYLTDTADHEQLGLYWESVGGIWGGRFGGTYAPEKQDGNHYEWPDP